MAAEVSSAFASLFRDLVRVELNRQGVVHSDKFICAAVQRLRVTGPNVRISLDGLEMGDKETIAVAETLIKLVSRTMLASHGVGRCDLGLAHNNLTDMSVPHLCMLVSRCPLLTLLDVRANSISPAGAQHIEEARLSSSSHCVVQLDSLRAAGANKGANTQASCSLPSSVLSRSASRQRGIDEEALQRRRSALFKGGKSAAPSSVVDSEKNLNGGYAREDVLSAKDGNLPVKEVIHQSGNTVGGSRPSTARADQCLERPATREVRPKVVDEPPGKVSARGGVGVDEATTVAQDCNTLGNVSPITTESAKSTNINECSIDVTENLSPLLQSVMDLTDSVSSGKLRTIYGTDDIWSVIRSNTTTGWNSPTKVDDLSSPITAVSNSLYQSVTVLCIGYNGLKSLDALPSTLIRLDVSNNELSSLSGLSECKMLTLLNARHNQLTCISGLEQNLSLSHLFLGNNKISFVDGIAHLFLLETLDLGHNKLKTQSAVRPLSLCRSLRHLVLRGNPVVESMKKCYHPVLRNLCPSLMFIDGARLHSSQLSNSGRTQSSHEAVDGARGAGAALALASENKDGTCTADYMSLLTRGVRVGTDVGGYSDPAQTSRAAKAMASYNKSKEEAKARQQRAHRSGGKVLREEMVNKIATKSKEYLESVLVERLASAQSSHILSDLSTLTAASESGILEDTGGTRLPTRCLSAPGRRPGGEYHGVIELDVDDVEECVHMQQRKQECRGANKVQGKRVISPARASSVGRRRQEVGAAAGGSPSCADSYGSACAAMRRSVTRTGLGCVMR
ncbi:hypothetical protein ERJ75_001607700 [Trypanosoma vivax]|nr:hypothetical protein ERJ75_001607700 [Trypanosoma vivax]